MPFPTTTKRMRDSVRRLGGLFSHTLKLTLRTDMQSEICNLTFHGKMGFAPPAEEGANVGRILDLGTGTGLWAIDYGDQHPETEVSFADDLCVRKLPDKVGE